jgi:hypothetical protein
LAFVAALWEHIEPLLHFSRDDRSNPAPTENAVCDAEWPSEVEAENEAAEWLKVTPLGEVGPPAMRVNMVVLGDGYTAEDFFPGGAWEVDIARLVPSFFKRTPFKTLRSLFNVFLVEVISQERGADDSPQRDSKKTALNCTYGRRGIEYLLNCQDPGAALRAAANAPGVDILIILVNDARRGGGSQKFGDVAVAICSSQAPSSVAIHELGHSFAGLGDEYVSAQTADRYPLPRSGDLAKPNLTLAALVDTTSQETLIKTLKWGHFLERPNADKAYGRGFVEGGYYRPSGVYRPAESCVMKSNWRTATFCFVCKDEMTKAIYRTANRGAGGGVVPEELPRMKDTLARPSYFYGRGLFGETIKEIERVMKKKRLTAEQFADTQKLLHGIETTLENRFNEVDELLKAGDAFAADEQVSLLESSFKNTPSQSSVETAGAELRRRETFKRELAASRDLLKLQIQLHSQYPRPGDKHSRQKLVDDFVKTHDGTMSVVKARDLLENRHGKRDRLR